MCAQNMRELTPPGAETFYSPSFHDSLKKPLDLRLPIVLQKLVCGAWECRFGPNRKKDFLSATGSSFMTTGYPDHLTSLLDSCDLLEFGQLLEKIVEHGISRLSCGGGAAFVFNGAMGRLELAACSDVSVGGTSFSLEPGSGTVGRAFEEGRMQCAPGDLPLSMKPCCPASAAFAPR